MLGPFGLLSRAQAFPIRAAPPETNDCAANETRNTQGKFSGGMNERLHLFSARHVSRLSCPHRTTHCLSPSNECRGAQPQKMPRLPFAWPRLCVHLPGAGAIFLCARRVFAGEAFAAKYAGFPCDTRAKSAEYRTDFNPLVFGLLPRALCGPSRQFREIPQCLQVKTRERIFVVAPIAPQDQEFHFRAGRERADGTKSAPTKSKPPLGRGRFSRHSSLVTRHCFFAVPLRTASSSSAFSCFTSPLARPSAFSPSSDCWLPRRDCASPSTD